MTDNRSVVLKGEEALEYARRHGVRLNQKLLPDGAAEGEGLSVEQAAQLLARDPAQVWLEVPSGVTSAD